MTCNPHNIHDGEMLPCIGGPSDGAMRRAEVLFPFMDGGLPAALLRVGVDHWYELDAAARCWRYKGRVKP